MSQRDLRRRLARFDRPLAGGRPSTAADEAAGDRRPFDHRRAGEERSGGEAEGAVGRAGSIEASLEGARWRGRGPSAYLRIEAEVDRSLWPGPPTELVDTEIWQRLAGGKRPSGENWTILDTETTGLQSGTGTLIFLVGLLHWTRRGGRLVQYLLPEPAAEGRMLSELWDDLRHSDALITFNGRSFDLPRLRTRALLSRLDPSVLQRPHLDLIHPARRVASTWLADCRLHRLETHWLGRVRRDDIPGEDIPMVYRAWLLDGESEGLIRVVRHNRRDVENLMELTRFLARLYGDGEDPVELPAAAELSLGRALAARGRTDAARLRFERAAESGDGEVARRSAAELTRLLKRRRDWDRVERLLGEALQRWPDWIWARVEIAKILEHRRRDIPAALGQVESSQRILQRRRAVVGIDSEAHWREALEHRKRRLHRRNERLKR